MEQVSVTEAVDRVYGPETYKLVLSNPASADVPYQRITVDCYGGSCQLEKYTKTQVFHKKLAPEEARAFLQEELGSHYRNLNAWDGQWEHFVMVSKKGKVTCGRKALSREKAPSPRTAHNRQKRYLLPEGEGIEPLVDMGVFTPEGRVVKAMYDKYRQINRFVEIIHDEVKKLDQNRLTVLDFGCGKSYLTFVLYYYFTRIRGMEVRMIGLDRKEDVIRSCAEAARKYGYQGMEFQVGDVETYRWEGQVDMVISLHACDTATDFALHSAVLWNAPMIFSAPCCQHELNAQIRTDRLSLLTGYGVIQERTAALLTDAIRGKLLEHCGYRTQLVEFVPFEHTPKNIMIRAVKKGAGNPKALAEVEAAMEEFHLDPALYRLLRDSGHL